MSDPSGTRPAPIAARVFLDSAGDLRELARRLQEPPEPGGGIYLMDRMADLRRLRETATLLGWLGLACGPRLV